MPRNHHPGASTLRNRNRITNKTRLKIHQGNLDVDAILIPDEDEEKHRLTNLVAGVDAEDANEHHLQAVLSAAHRNSAAAQRSQRETKVAAPAYIPVPDSTGVVENYEELYPTTRWKDPASYLCTSTTVEETVANGLAGGFTYYMDERDMEWLDKNNEEARGEGTSASGAVSSASGTRVSARSAKAKGKEPEVSQPIAITEDEFELVMGLFEKITHEKTEFLHHSLETGMAFPAFNEYQETFNSPLLPTVFSSYEVPSWIPQSAQLVRISKAIYPHWKERRVERGGQRIIPVLNFDEADTLNESYICFRRREIKAVRKTRASQATFSDKLGRLQAELNQPLELAQLILNRETIKKESTQQAQVVWEKRLALVDLKRKYPSLGDKGDEELLVDKERPVKKAEIFRLPPRPRPDAAISIVMKPRERIALINKQIEATLQRQKEVDHHSWEDSIDNGYQPQPVPYASRLFKFITPPNTPRSTDTDSDGEGSTLPRPIRLRIGRGGRRIIDRRSSRLPTINRHASRSALLAALAQERGEAMSTDDDGLGEEMRQRLESRWRFDVDDVPPHGPLGPEEQDRVLVDDYEPTYLRHYMTIYSDSDQQSLITDPSFLITLPDGRQQFYTPFRLGMPPPQMRQRPNYPPHVLQALQQQAHQHAQQHQQQQGQQQSQPQTQTQQTAVAISLPTPTSSGTPISVQQQIKKMPPPIAMPQMRISSNGGMRPPSLPVANGISQTNVASASHGSPPQPTPVPQHSPTHGGNGISRAAIAMPHVDAMKMDTAPLTAIPNGVVSIQPPQMSEAATHQQQAQEQNGTSTVSPTRPKSQPSQPQPASPVAQQSQAQTQQQHHAMTNGYHLVNGFNNTANVGNTTPYSQHQNTTGGLSLQQMQTLKTTFANLPPPQDLAALQASRNLSAQLMHVAAVNGNPNYNLQLGAGANVNVKLAGRPMQWSVASPLQRPPSAMNGIEGVAAVNGSMSPSPTAVAVPVRASSATGHRPTMRNTSGHILSGNGQLNAHVHSMSPRMQPSPSPLPNIAQSQSPPRLPAMTPMAPNMNIASPSLGHQQPVGTSQSGY